MQIREKADGYRMAIVDYHAPVMTHALADALSDINATGLVLTPVGANEPAEWYGLAQQPCAPPYGDSAEYRLL